MACREDGPVPDAGLEEERYLGDEIVFEDVEIALLGVVPELQVRSRGLGEWEWRFL